MAARPAPEDVLALALTRYVLAIIQLVHFGSRSRRLETTLEGTPSSGKLVTSDGQGSIQGLSWSSDGVVGWSADAHRPKLAGTEWEPTALALWRASPSTLQALAEGFPVGVRAPTAAFWVSADELRRTGDDGKLGAYLGSSEGALQGDGMSGGFGGWLEETELSVAHGELAAALGRTILRGPCIVTPEESATLMNPAPEPHGAIAASDVRRAADLLARLGVSWPDAARVVTSLRKQKSADKPASDLLAAVFAGDLQRAAELLEKGAPVEARTKPRQFENVGPGDTPLMLAAMRRDVKMTELLLRHGADPNARNVGVTPLSRAAAPGSIEVCDLLLRAGADPLLLEAELPGIVLDMAFRSGDAALMRFLFERGAGLPNPIRRRDLARLASEAGDEELAQRILTAP